MKLTSVPYWTGSDPKKHNFILHFLASFTKRIVSMYVNTVSVVWEMKNTYNKQYII